MGTGQANKHLVVITRRDPPPVQAAGDTIPKASATPQG